MQALPPDCYGCRAAQARFCCACVQQAVTERHALERAAHAEKAKLEHAMADGIAARTRLLSQREARRAHLQLMADLKGELSKIRRESSRLADDVNGLRHAVCRSRTRLSEQPQAPPRAPTPAATAETTAAAAKGLTSARAALIHELLTLQDDVWCDVSVDEQLDEQLLRLKPPTTQPKASKAGAGAGGTEQQPSSRAIHDELQGRGSGAVLPLVNGRAAGSGGSGVETAEAAAADSGARWTLGALGTALSTRYLPGLSAQLSQSIAHLSSGGELVPTQLFHSQLSGLAHEIGLVSMGGSAEFGGGGGSSSVDGNSVSKGVGQTYPLSVSSPAQRLARDLGHAVLLLTMLANYLGLRLPYTLIFESSTSVVWHPGDHRPLRLSPGDAPPSEVRQARAFLAANVKYLLAHLPARPAAPVSPMPPAPGAPGAPALPSPGPASPGCPGAAIPASSARSTAEELLLLRDTLCELLTAPSLAWEVDAAQCALWTGEADEELHEAGLWARSGERDEWDLVQPPEVPTPSQGEEIARWEAAMLAENVRGGATAAGVRIS
jgi:hypothetical protein